MATSAELAGQFHAAMAKGDVQALRSILASDVSFTGPLASTKGADEFIAGVSEMAKITSSDDVKVQLSDGANAILWSTLVTKAGSAIETATWLQISDGKISAVRTVFDPRAAGAR